jgi:hypothetical protein
MNLISFVEPLQARQSTPSPDERKSFMIPTVPMSSAKPSSGQWQDRVVHNYLVDSTDNYPNLMSQHRPESPHSSPPYLSLPKVPPPGMSSQQASEFLFHVADKNGSGVVSKDELLTTLQEHPELAEVQSTFSSLALHHFSSSSLQQLNLSADDGTLDHFTQRTYRLNNASNINLNEFVQLLHDTSHLSPTVTRQSPSFHRQSNHHYWETESVPDPREREGVKSVWASQEYALNPNRISVQSDDILLNPRADHHPPPHPQRHSSSPDPHLGLPPSRVGSSRDQQSHSQPMPPTMSLQIPHSMASPNHLSASQPNGNLPLGADPLQQGRRPPLHTSRSYNDFQRESSSKQQEGEKMLERRFPPPPSELGVLMRVILEGWLEKKSSKLGIWQKVHSLYPYLSLTLSLSLSQRYFVLAFGNSIVRSNLPGAPCIQLQIFKKAMESAWGMVPLGVSLTTLSVTHCLSIS